MISNTLQVEISPKDYGNRMKLIEALRRSGELEAVREQRECISTLYTMPPSFWLDWIELVVIRKNDQKPFTLYHIFSKKS